MLLILDTNNIQIFLCVVILGEFNRLIECQERGFLSFLCCQINLVLVLGFSVVLMLGISVSRKTTFIFSDEFAFITCQVQVRTIHVILHQILPKRFKFALFTRIDPVHVSVVIELTVAVVALVTDVTGIYRTRRESCTVMI